MYKRQVQARASSVWLATWARLSPVISAAAPSAAATRWAMRSMLRRISTVNRLSLIHSFISPVASSSRWPTGASRTGVDQLILFFSNARA